MKIKVTEKQVMITELSQVIEGEYGINECEFILPKSFDGLCVTAIFNGIPTPVVNSKCFIPSLKNGNCIVGVYAYRETLGETEVMYSPRPTMFFVDKGSFTEDIREAVIPQKFDYDLYCEMLRDYWADLIKSNTVPKYTENATEKQYYSAKAVNEIFDVLGEGLIDTFREDMEALKTELQGEIDEQLGVIENGSY